MHVNVLINVRFNKCTFMFYLQTNEFAQLCCRFADIFSAAPIYISLGINIVSCYCDIAVGGRQSTCAKGGPLPIYILTVIAHYQMSCCTQ